MKGATLVTFVKNLYHPQKILNAMAHGNCETLYFRIDSINTILSSVYQSESDKNFCAMEKASSTVLSLNSSIFLSIYFFQLSQHISGYLILQFDQILAPHLPGN